MGEWQYKIHPLEISEEPAKSLDELEAQKTAFLEGLDRLGKLGWEAVGQVTISAETHFAGAGQALQTDQVTALLLKRNIDPR